MGMGMGMGMQAAFRGGGEGSSLFFGQGSCCNGDSGSNNGGDSGSNNGSNNGGGTPSPALVQVTGIAPHLALASAEAFTGDEEANTISYENADEGVTVDLQVPANNRGRFAQKDTYANIENIVGSSHADTLIGNSQDNRLEGGTGADTYAFRTLDGTDTVVDDGGKIVFLQGTNNDYTDATYTFTRADGGQSESVTLTVKDSDDNTLNVIELTSYPSSGYGFYTRIGDIDTEIPASLLVVPARVTGDGSENNPYLATDIPDSFAGSGIYDWVSYAGSNEGVAIDLGSNPAAVSDGWATGDTLADINNLIGSDAADTLSGDGDQNTLRGAGGDDTLQGGNGADVIDGGQGTDAAVYDNSLRGVRVNLLLQGQPQEDFDGTHGFVATLNDALGDILANIENLDGSKHDDWLMGDGDTNELFGDTGNDRLEGGAGADTYRFGVSDGTDTVVDDGGKIVFLQGTNNDYTDATYTFTRADGGQSEAVTLTVAKDGNTLNVIELTNYPSSGYGFYTRIGDIDTEIPASLLVVPARVTGDGGENNPYLATDIPDSFAGSGIYDWVSYAGSNEGVAIDLGSNPAAVSDGWAAGDTLRGINNLIGSDAADTLSGNGNRNTLRGGGGDDILDGRGYDNTLEGGGGQDDYIFDSGGGDRIRYDPDGGRILCRGESIGSSLALRRDSAGDVIVSFGSTAITIADGGEEDAYQHGSYSVHYGTSDTFSRNIYLGYNDLGDTLTGTSNSDFMVALSGDDTLDSGSGNDFLYSGSGNDLLDGGRGNDRLAGGSGGDTYRFDAGDGTDVAYDTDITTNNKVIFRAPSGVSYTNDNFLFARGNQEGGAFAESATGSDLQITTRTGSGGNFVVRNLVFIEGYFGKPDSAYTIYHTSYNSASDGTVVSTQPAESS